MAWKDGTEKTVHLDPPMLITYRKRLLAFLRLVNERVRWLGTGSRRLFANLSENVLTIVIDVTKATRPYMSLLRAHLRRIFEEQLKHAHWFNLVVFDHEATR